jgi:hypothetical protein
MNDDDLRLLYAGMAMMGFLMNGDYHAVEIPMLSVQMADSLISELNKSDDGIAAIKKRVRKPKSI